jgi:curli biogenesis system outer membrane secretion channel CsgG
MLKKGVAQMLISGLTPVASNWRIVERDRLEAILKELELVQAGKVDARTAAKVGKLVGARYIVMGSFFDLFGNLRIDAKLVDVETGVILGSISGQGKLDDFFSVYEGLVKKLGELLKTKAKPGLMRTDKDKKGTERSTNVPKALKTATVLEYSQALDAKDRGDKAAAKKHLEAAIKSQPDFEAAVLDLNALTQ